MNIKGTVPFVLHLRLHFTATVPKILFILQQSSINSILSHLVLNLFQTTMATVLSHLKAFDLPQKDEIVVTTRSIDKSSPIREILAYHKFHVKVIEEFIVQYDELERKYERSETVRKLLESQNTQKDKRIKELETIVAQRDLTIKDLTANVASLEKRLKEKDDEIARKDQRIKDLETVIAQRDETIKGLRDMNALLEEEIKQKDEEIAELNLALEKKNVEIRRLEEENDRLETKLREANESYNKLQREYCQAIEELEERLATANCKIGKLERDSSELEAAKAKAERDAREAKRKLADLCANGEKVFMHHPDRARGGVYIDEVVYGGTVIKEQGVFKDLLNYAVNGKDFTVSNDLMKGDPWKGTEKSLVIAYTTSGKGPFKYINAREGKKVRFV